MKIAAIAPVFNEVDYIGYSIMAALPGVDSMHYGIDAKSDDGTFELVKMLADTAGKGKVFWYKAPDFDIDVMNQKQYEGAYNALIECAISMKPDAILYLHPDMIITNPEQMLALKDDALAFFTHITSFAGDMKTIITKGRDARWKNIHSPRFRLTYCGAYGSQNEDFYHKDITGNAYRHYGTEFSKYPFRVVDSGIKINHYCELRDYKRRLEKMKLCMKTLYPDFSDARIEQLAVQHPRVTLEQSSRQFGTFEFSESKEDVPEVFAKYKETFDQFKTKETSNGKVCATR
jgi:hypothetical protein